MNPPLYPDFKPLGLEDQDLVKRYLDAHPSGVCEMNFPNLLIWKDSERPRYTILNGNLCLLVEPTFEPAYFLPPAGGNEVEKTIKTCLTHAPRLSRVPEAYVEKYGSAFRVEEDRDNFDYVYLGEELAELKGKKFDGKRNRIKKFESSFDHAYVELRREHSDDCRRLLLQWFEEKGNGDPYMKAEKDAILEALEDFEMLGLTGRVVTVAGRVEAFTFGMRLTDDTALIQIEIANPAFPGLAQWINREFVRREWSAFRFINREQDMGVPGLRTAKLSYQPDHLVKKFNLYKE
ncbi:MAG: phosphatidylglycerol lysyltransferase domain-containing protein [Candidatus Aminicenantales bacterium]|jgi:hypothetical protein